MEDHVLLVVLLPDLPEPAPEGVGLGGKGFALQALPAFLVLAQLEDDVGYLRDEEFLDGEANGVA